MKESVRRGCVLGLISESRNHGTKNHGASAQKGVLVGWIVVRGRTAFGLFLLDMVSRDEVPSQRMRFNHHENGLVALFFLND